MPSFLYFVGLSRFKQFGTRRCNVFSDLDDPSMPDSDPTVFGMGNDLSFVDLSVSGNSVVNVTGANISANGFFSGNSTLNVSSGAIGSFLTLQDQATAITDTAFDSVLEGTLSDGSSVRFSTIQLGDDGVINISSIPEPSALMLISFAGMAGLLPRRKQVI